MHLQIFKPLTSMDRTYFGAAQQRSARLATGQKETRHKGGFPGDSTGADQAATEPSRRSENGVSGMARSRTAMIEATSATPT